ncbi:hypothetical protein ACINNAV18_3369 [Acinetobacter baumannii Naval-18]|nr:hypothetical protein ACINNAV18_3369 [Acinetobacter baumannii Naval-18]
MLKVAAASLVNISMLGRVYAYFFNNYFIYFIAFTYFL